MVAERLDGIDWSAESYDITEGISVDLSADGGINRPEMISRVVHAFEQVSEDSHHVYCLMFTKGGEECWYVGETENLSDRIKTHLYEKEVTDLEVIEGCDSRKEALEREREMSYEVAIAKNSTEIYGGR